MKGQSKIVAALPPDADIPDMKLKSALRHFRTLLLTDMVCPWGCQRHINERRNGLLSATYYSAGRIDDRSRAERVWTRRPTAKARLSHKTQIVVQWLNGGNDGPSVAHLFDAENRLENESSGLYIVDGNDIGGGTFNVFIYADDAQVDVVVHKLIAMHDQLPNGMRIGVAVYKDAQRKDWTFRPVYPDGLREFYITYGAERWRVFPIG
ncbi:MAG: hypothetical protein P4L57_00200 [Rhizomicrobium sp.]|nr:hypothetical protein [Rhizomicrobium sp.]